MYVDGSFGQGGHATEILRRLAADGRLVALDVDPRAQELATHMAALDKRLDFYKERASNLSSLVGSERVAGLLLDMSPQMTAADERATGLLLRNLS